jgi:hypothetical protein
MSIINIVGTVCFPDKEERFNQWYNEKHIPDLMKFKGIKKVTRYKMIGAAEGPREHPLPPVGAKDGYPKYIAIYEFEDLETFEKYDHSSEAAAARRDGDAETKEIGVQHFWRVQYETIKVWKQSPKKAGKGVRKGKKL